MPMEWKCLLSDHRLGKKDSPTRSRTRTIFERDFDRILYSNTFRRLHDKTQVMPMPGDDHVHSRLLHSLETASTGRSLGKGIAPTIIERHDLSGVVPSDFGDIVASACLAHDLGNPPFGHMGEDAIGSWFKEHPRLFSDLKKDQRREFENFEGNALGFRSLARLSTHADEGGMQLTCATLRDSRDTHRFPRNW